VPVHVVHVHRHGSRVPSKSALQGTASIAMAPGPNHCRGKCCNLLKYLGCATASCGISVRACLGCAFVAVATSCLLMKAIFRPLLPPPSPVFRFMFVYQLVSACAMHTHTHTHTHTHIAYRILHIIPCIGPIFTIGHTRDSCTRKKYGHVC